MGRKVNPYILQIGDVAEKCGVSVNIYCNVHTWLRRKFGPANKCENKECSGKSNGFHYALLKGKEYKKDRNNFITLCRSCHSLYDWDESKHQCMRIFSDERKRKIGLAQIGRKRSEEEKAAASKRMSGKNNPMYGVRLTKEKNHFYGKTHSEKTKEIIMLSRAQLSKDVVLEIRERHMNGEMQKDIAGWFKITTATVCRIVNRKIYKQW